MLLAKSYIVSFGNRVKRCVCSEGLYMYRVSIEKEADSGDEHHDPLEVLTVDGLVDLSHANLAVLHITFVSPCSTSRWSDRHTCSCSKSRARSVLYSRLRNRPIAKDLSCDMLIEAVHCVDVRNTPWARKRERKEAHHEG